MTRAGEAGPGRPKPHSTAAKSQPVAAEITNRQISNPRVFEKRHLYSGNKQWLVIGTRLRIKHNIRSVSEAPDCKPPFSNLSRARGVKKRFGADSPLVR